MQSLHQHVKLSVGDADESNPTIHDLLLSGYLNQVKTHDSESRGQEEAGHTRDEQVSYLHVAPL